MADLQHAFVRRPDTDGFHIKSLDLEGSLQVWNLPYGEEKKISTIFAAKCLGLVEGQR